MNKLGIWTIAIASAFVLGMMIANPFAEGVGGWKEALQGVPTTIIKTIPDCNCDPPTGWSPPSDQHLITDSDVTADSFIATLTEDVTQEISCGVYRGTFEGNPMNDNQFGVWCPHSPSDGAMLKYMITNP